jgi:hypothetical protein
MNGSLSNKQTKGGMRDDLWGHGNKGSIMKETGVCKALEKFIEAGEGQRKLERQAELWIVLFPSKKKEDYCCYFILLIFGSEMTNFIF